ncbi:MAG: hypothetical protein EOP33_02060 [Rickettsiaceae bacterium]|nr:MAG: hypothetical protein EOP33_02060 [Rickettsiaceae bacterium]
MHNCKNSHDCSLQHSSNILLSNENSFKTMVNSNSKYIEHFSESDQQVIASGINFATANIVNHWRKLDDNQKKNYTIALAKSYDRTICLANNMLDLAYINSKDFIVQSRLTDIGLILTDKCFEYNLVFGDFYNIPVTCSIRGKAIANCNGYYIRRLLDNVLSEILDNLDHVAVEITLKDYITISHRYACIEILIHLEQLKEIRKLANIFDKILKINIESDIRTKLINKIISIHHGKVSVNQQAQLGIVELMIPH